VQRALDLPHAVAMAAERCPVRLFQSEPAAWEFPRAVAARLGWDARRLELLPLAASYGEIAR
jgi:hypothetical protein